MFKDPFGGTDWDAIARVGILVGFLFVFVALGGAAEGNWYDPFNYVLLVMAENATLTIGIIIVTVMVGFTYSQFNGGFY